ncbi:MAG: insulinase family protein [Proteobacteria bacterium]|nr:insulinase family protein [Pseudomonadota bacterium]
MPGLATIKRLEAHIIFIAASIVFIAGVAFVPAQAGVFNPETFTLENGLQVVVIPNHRSPVVSQMVWYKVGSADDPPGKSGVAHLLEHLMFKGTKVMAPGEYSKILARNGGRENAFTSNDTTAYYQVVAVDRLELVMKLEADRMVNLVLTDADVLPERNVVVEERRARTDNNPAALLDEQMSAALYLNHPYRRPVIGWKHELESLTTEDVLAFYRRYYAPDNAILIVSGDITADKLKPLAEKYYGSIPARKVAKRVRLKEPPHRAARRVQLRSPQVREPRWGRDYLAPGFSSGEKRHAYALEVLNDILAGGATSRLYRSLVVEQKIAVSAGASYDGDAYDLGTFSFYGQPAAGIGMDRFEAAMDAEIAKLLGSGVTINEVKRAKKRLLAGAIYARDSLRRGARAIGTALTTGQTVDDVETWPEHIKAVTRERVNEAARAVFKISNSVTGLLLPEKAQKAQKAEQP